MNCVNCLIIDSNLSIFMLHARELAPQTLWIINDGLSTRPPKPIKYITSKILLCWIAKVFYATQILKRQTSIYIGLKHVFVHRMMDSYPSIHPFFKLNLLSKSTCIPVRNIVVVNSWKAFRSYQAEDQQLVEICVLQTSLDPVSHSYTKMQLALVQSEWERFLWCQWKAHYVVVSHFA